jgi:putative phosphoribosyl transferase
MITSILHKEQVSIPAGTVLLAGDLIIPENTDGIVAFAHGSGSSRHSRRNQFVAGVLQEGRLATLLMDLLSEEEEVEDAYTAEYRFNIPMLAERLVAAVDWLSAYSETARFNIGLFGASTGGAAALIAAANRPNKVKAVVSRGGRPDLAANFLSRVQAPALLIVGSNDEPVIEMNQMALDKMTCPKELVLVPGATHLFEEPGALEQVARLARQWFAKNLA